MVLKIPKTPLRNIYINASLDIKIEEMPHENAPPNYFQPIVTP